MKIGIVDYKTNNYYVVDKLFYKTKVYADNLKPGDILLFKESGLINENNSQLKKNILYTNSNYEIIYNLKIRNFISNRINNLNDETKSSLNHFIYQIYDEGFNNDVYISLISYYLLKDLFKHNKKLTLLFIAIFSLVFNFQTKYFLILFEIILAKFNLKERLVISIYFLLVINPYLLTSYSILIPLIIKGYQLIDLKIEFKLFLMIVQSLLIYQINILMIFVYKYYLFCLKILYILGLFIIVFPDLSSVFITLYNTFINFFSFSFIIRGQISILSLIIFYYLINKIELVKPLKTIIFLLLLILPINNPFSYISFIDVNQGDAIFIRLFKSNENILIDTGSKYNYYKLKNYLYKKGIYKIDYLIITHDDEDHNGNIANLQDDFTINNIITEGKDVILNDTILKYYYLDEYENTNDNSLVYALNINNLSFLFTGDISKYAEKTFIQKYNEEFDFLKISHHGSNTSSSEYFLTNIKPKYALISTNGYYNHPHTDIINTLKKYEINYLITKDNKDIEIYFLNGFNILKYHKNNFVIIK